MRKIALGTVQFGLDYGLTNPSGQVAIDEVRKILIFAKKNEIDILDTASGYGNSEQVLGKIGVDNYQIITKTISLKNGVDRVIDGFYQSLDNLGQKQVEGLLIHNIQDIENKQFNILFDKLNKLKKEGLIKKIGFSTYTPEQVSFLLENFDFDLIQLPFNILDNRLVDSGMFKVLQNRGIEVHARSVFLQGLLLMNEKNRPSKFRRWDALWKTWHEWINDNQITVLEASIRYVISIPEISKVLVGVDTKDQLKEIIVASYGFLPNIPPELHTTDVNLLNPSNWDRL